VNCQFEKSRLSKAKRYGADAAIDPNADNPVAAIKDLTAGYGADCTLDCSGSPQAQAVKSVRKWARAAFVGEGGDVTIDVSNDMNRKQVTVMGCWTFSKNGQAGCARFVAERKLDMDSLFTHSWPLDDAAEACGCSTRRRPARAHYYLPDFEGENVPFGDSGNAMLTKGAIAFCRPCWLRNDGMTIWLGHFRF
jgi:threonine dehydrogenase-like Zn-dependent dehydrogenase